jgi:hypothetical protein
MTCFPKTDPVVKLVLHYIIGLKKGETLLNLSLIEILPIVLRNFRAIL